MTYASHVTQVKAGPFTHAFKKACEFETELDAKLLVTSSGLGVSDGFSATGVMNVECVWCGMCDV